MPKVYTRKYQRELHDLYNVLLFCDVSVAITEKRQDELRNWLWRQMGPYHKEWGKGPHTRETKKIEALPRSAQLVRRYQQLLSKNAHTKAPAEKAKDMLQKEFGFSKREALEKALYRARKKHPLEINYIPF
jgi:hypothetical protein